MLGGDIRMVNNIKAAREKSGYTQQACADVLGLKLRTLQTYEQGVSEPKMEMLCKMADTFGVTVDYLLGREQTASTESLRLNKIKEHIDAINDILND